jgi:hypothetical protein
MNYKEKGKTLKGEEMIRGIEQQGDRVVIYADTYQEAIGFFYGLVDDGKIEDSEFSYGGNK